MLVDLWFSIDVTRTWLDMANSKRNSPFNKHGMLWNLQKCMELFNLLHWMLMD